MVSSTVVPFKIKLQYHGTYLLYSPPTTVFSAPVSQQPTQPPLVPTASLLGSAQATLPSQQGGQRSSTTAAPAQASVVAAANAYTRGSGLASTPAQPQQLLPATPAVSPQAPSPAAVTQAQATGYDSDDSDVKAMVKIVQVQYEGKQYPVLGKGSVIKILCDTQSVRALMETGQLEKLVRHEGNFVNNYTPSVFRAGLLRQHSLASIQIGMTLIVHENHDLVRLQSLVCYDMPELQRSLYTFVTPQYALSTYCMSLRPFHS